MWGRKPSLCHWGVSLVLISPFCTFHCRGTFPHHPQRSRVLCFYLSLPFHLKTLMPTGRRLRSLTEPCSTAPAHHGHVVGEPMSLRSASACGGRPGDPPVGAGPPGPCSEGGWNEVFTLPCKYILSPL